jgi:ribosomal protein S18 acetylase RimI-like enzyme
MTIAPPPTFAELDNPIWHSLTGSHRSLGESWAGCRWYHSAIAPFIGVASAGCRPDLDGATSRGFREPGFFVGVIPDELPGGWRVSASSVILQMLPTRDEAPGVATPDDDDSDIRILGTEDRPAMLALTRIAFPDYFRERTAELGTYLGIVAGSRLVAMAGERLAVDGMHEISGVCTHPEFAGRGYARRLTQALLRRHRRRGVGSFLHVSESNAVARRLYASMGFEVRAALPLAKIEHIERGAGAGAA